MTDSLALCLLEVFADMFTTATYLGIIYQCSVFSFILLTQCVEKTKSINSALTC